ncbi:hypothetical protein QYF36_005416 [Acer negundo]|nr:hypothetical protein QYF36_005416 [Acer negundo]
MGYTFDALKTYVPEMVELFIDCARNPIFLDWIGRSMNRIVLAASFVEHDQLLSVAEPLLSDLPSISRPEEPKSLYTGCDYRCQADSGDQSTHFALAFEFPVVGIRRRKQWL